MSHTVVSWTAQAVVSCIHLARRTHTRTRMQQQTQTQTDTHTYSPHPTVPCPPPAPPLLTAHTQVWAKELAKHQIRVGAIAPGVVHTKILDSVRMTSRKDTNTLCRERERRHTETDT